MDDLIHNESEILITLRKQFMLNEKFESKLQSSFQLMKQILKSLWRISEWLNMISIDELNQSRRYLTSNWSEVINSFKLIWMEIIE